MTTLMEVASDLDRDNAEATRQLAEALEKNDALRAENAWLTEVLQDMSGTGVML